MGAVSGSSSVGGIVGYAANIAERERHTKFICNSYNKGKITATTEGAGGIIGWSDCGSDIKNCVNTTAEIKGAKWSGSLLANVYGSAYAYDYASGCYYNGSLNAIGVNNAEVTSSTSFTGEINMNSMFYVLKYELSQVNWNGNSVDVW